MPKLGLETSLKLLYKTMNGKGVMPHAYAIGVFKLYIPKTENRKPKTENLLH
jgi:hypothetical protein